MTLSAEAIVRKTSGIYSLPSIYTELDRQINDPFSNLEDIAKTLLDDAGLSSRILKLANSAMYSFPSRIDTVTKAITIIGTNQLRDLALATSVISIFKGIDSLTVNMEQFWRHSIAVGICARVIATYRSEPNVERYYLMGLLHDIGRIPMMLNIPDDISVLIAQCKEKNKPLYELERKILGFDHARVGALLLGEWKLPKLIVESVGRHHNPTVSRSHATEASIIHLSDFLINAFQMGTSSGVGIAPILNDKALDLVGISHALLPDMLSRIQTQYDDVVEVFLS